MDILKDSWVIRMNNDDNLNWNEFIQFKRVGFSAKFFGKPFWWKTPNKKARIYFCPIESFSSLSKIKAISFSMTTKGQPNQHSYQQANNSTLSELMKLTTANQQHNNMLLIWEHNKVVIFAWSYFKTWNWKRKRKKMNEKGIFPDAPDLNFISQTFATQSW